MTLQEIERAVEALSPEDLKAFCEWFAAFEAKLWDRQFELDVVAGRLDALADRALQQLHNGECSDL